MFIEKCDELGRVTLEQALSIGDSVGLFDDSNLEEIVLRAHKQKVRTIFRNHTRKGERILRNVKEEPQNVFVNIYDINAVTKKDVRFLINDEDKKIDRSSKTIRHLERVNSMIDGQLTLDEVFTYDELYVSTQ